MHFIVGDLLYLLLWSHIFVLLEHVLGVAAPHIAARSPPDQQVLRRPPHLGRGQAAQVRAHVVFGLYGNILISGANEYETSAEESVNDPLNHHVTGNLSWLVGDFVKLGKLCPNSIDIFIFSVK